MKRNEASVFVFIASVIIGVLISMNINFGEKNKVFLNIDQYNDAYNKRNKLYKDISDLQYNINKNIKKLKKYENEKNNTTTITEEIFKEIDNYKNYMGLNALQGEGVRITLNDANASEFGKYYSDFNLVHDIDIWFLINDLRICGAEAIAINGQRIIGNTYSYCGGTYIEIKGGKIVAPFYIDVIGSSEAITEYLKKESNHVKNLVELRKIRMDIVQDSKIKIPAYDGEMKFKYANKKNKE